MTAIQGARVGAVTPIVPTVALQTLLLAAPAAFEDRWVVAVDGPSGCGKTTALLELVRAWPGNAAMVELETGSTHKEVIETLYRAVAGAVPTTRGLRRSDMTQTLRHLLAGSDLLVVVDEAQKGGMQALEMLRQMHQHPTARWHLVLSGAELFRKLERERMFDGRTGLKVRFAPLVEPELTATLAAMSPVLAALDADLLSRTDAAHCRGNLREWNKVLSWLLKIVPEGTAPSRVHLEQAVSWISGKPVRI